MNKFELISNYDELDSIIKVAKESEINISVTPTFNLSQEVEGILHFLTVGGGLAGFAKLIISYLNIKNQKRKIRLKLHDLTEVEIEGNSISELEVLLEKTKTIIIQSTEQKQ